MLCPGCGGALIARQGALKTWCFAHTSDAACPNGYESALHLAVKQLVERERKILLPGCFVWRHPAGYLDPMSPTYEYCTGDPRELRAGGWEQAEHSDNGVGTVAPKLIHFDRVELEQSDGQIRPDIVGHVRDRKIYIEVAVTHFVDKDKAARIRQRGISTVEIDLSPHHGKQWGWKDLERLLFDEPIQTNWLLNRVAEKAADKDRDERVRRATAKRQRDDARRVRREASFKKHYQPSHEIWFTALNSTTKVIVSLCPSHVRAKMWSQFDPGLQPAFSQVGRDLGGSYNEVQYQWEFQPPTEETYDKVVRLLWRAIGNQLYRAKEPNDDFDAALRRLGFISWQSGENPEMLVR